MKIQRKAVVAKFGVCVLIVNLLAATAPGIALAQPPEYNFTHIATLGDSAPGGGKFINDFEPWSINSSGDMAFAADLDTEGEGIFISRKGQISEIMRSGQPAPGGGTFNGGVLSHSPINDKGDVAFTFTLGDFPLAGVYHFTRATGSL